MEVERKEKIGLKEDTLLEGHYFFKLVLNKMLSAYLFVIPFCNCYQIRQK